MYVCVLTHCKITRPIVILYQRRKPKREEKRALHLVPYIHNSIFFYQHIHYIFKLHNTHTYIHIHIKQMISSLYCLFVFFVTRNSNKTVIYHHFPSFACKIHKTINLFSPSTLCYIHIYKYTYTIIKYLLHFFIFQCMSVGVFASKRISNYNSICYLFGFRFRIIDRLRR